MIDLGDETSQGTGRNINLLSIIGAASSVNIKASQDLTDRLVDTENNLDSVSLVSCECSEV